MYEVIRKSPNRRGFGCSVLFLGHGGSPCASLTGLELTELCLPLPLTLASAGVNDVHLYAQSEDKCLC